MHTDQSRNFESQQERTFDVGDLVYTRNLGTIVGQSKKLLPQWKGAIRCYGSNFTTPVPCYWRRDVKLHDKLRICEDFDISFWMRRERLLILTTEEPATDLKLGDDLLDGAYALFRPSYILSIFQWGRLDSTGHQNRSTTGATTQVWWLG